MGMADRIRNQLGTLHPLSLEVVDDSAKHHGHAGWREGGDTHFRLQIVSAAFAGKSKVQRQRMVYGALAAEFADGLHALSISAMTPDEAAAQD